MLTLGSDAVHAWWPAQEVAMARFARDIDFTSLSVRDLLEAREHYHVHLANLDNVIGTAVSRYRIRHSDPDYDNPRAHKNQDDPTPRTLTNSGVRPWSWPCILVLVSHWETRAGLSGRPAQFVPPRLYLPDGRVVPTCVVLAPLDPAGPPPVQQLSFPSGLTGGGYPILTDDQGQTRVGSIGCLVTDGSYTYALTGEHVVADPGTPAFTLQSGRRVRIAASHRKAVRKVVLESIYPGWPGLRSMINVDAGLFRIEDVSQWTSQVFGIGTMGELIDLNVDTMTLDLIGCPVRANGGASGPLQGEIQALFYRYHSVGGFDYVAELLIGPRRDGAPVVTHPGDSGTVWFWDADHDETQSTTRPRAPRPSPPPGSRTPELRPLGVQWGGQTFLDAGGAPTQFALASCLSTVCQQLDVELVRSWAIGHSLYWGKVGHYKVATTACLLASNALLAQLLTANLGNISVSDQNIVAGQLPTGSTTHFVALADVADLVWRTTRPKDEANHFADMDQPGGPNGTGPTLLDLWQQQPASRTPKAWTAFYDGLPDPPLDRHRGALPFRVKEMYGAMVDAVRQGNTTDYIAVAGLMAHYVGDACQPLHVSRFHHGHPDHPEENAVHSDYETKMLDRFAPDVVAKVNTAVGGRHVSQLISGADAAANLVVDLMRRTIERLDPEVVVNTWIDTKGSHHIADLWAALGDDTAASMAEGALALATLWQSAWAEGGGDSTIPAGQLGVAVNKNALRARYSKASFVQSRWLREM
jgi:hypothetical protein